MTVPFGGIVASTGEGWDGIPDSPNPFYLAAGDALYIHKRMLIGRGLARTENMPPYPKFGNRDGGFIFEADPIPAKIMGQIVNFFERIYDRQHTEAAVLLTMHAQTKEWRVYVPTQLVSHGGVNYVFDPATILYPWVIVGSIHSHCDFGAGHSGTDTGDAGDGNDGLHCTIGHIKDKVPQIVAMVATNQRLFHFKPESFDKLFDYSECKEHEAPAWWDRYVEDTNAKTKPVGFDLYAKFQKSTVVKSENKTKTGQASPGYQSKGFVSGDWTYDNNAKRMVHKSWKVMPDGSIEYPGGVHGSITPQNGKTKSPGPTILSESRAFNARRAAERGLKWSKDGHLDLEKSGLKVTDVTPEEMEMLLLLGGKDLTGIGDDDLDYMGDVPNAIAEAFFDDTANVMTEADEEWAMLHRNEAKSITSWREIMVRKLYNTMMVCRELGLPVEIKMDKDAARQLLLPGGPDVDISVEVTELPGVH
jgi:hypothetical protein